MLAHAHARQGSDVDERVPAATRAADAWTALAEVGASTRSRARSFERMLVCERPRLLELRGEQGGVVTR